MRMRSYQYRQRLVPVTILLLLLGCAPAAPIAQPPDTPVAPTAAPAAPTVEPDAESFFLASIQVSALTVAINETIVVTATLTDSTPPPYNISFGARLSRLCIRTIPAEMAATPVPATLGPDDSCIANQNNMTYPTPVAPILATSDPHGSLDIEGRNWIETYRLRAVRPGTVTLTFGVNGEMAQDNRLWFTTYSTESPQIRVVASVNAAPTATLGR